MAALVPAVRLTNREYDNRVSPTFPVARSALQNIVVADGTNTKTGSAQAMNGQVIGIRTAAPPIPTDADFTITLKDEDGNTYTAKASIADNGNLYTDISGDNVAVQGLVTTTVSFTTVLSGNTAEFDVDFLIQSRV